MIFIFLIVLGLFSGLLGGLLGIGGGVVVVPGLFYLFSVFGYPPEHLMQIAVSTSLAVTCLTTLGSSFIHWHRKTIVVSILRLLIPGLIGGCLIGTFLAYWIPTNALRTVFGVAAFLMGPYFFFPHLPSLKIASAPNRSLSFIALTIGTVASLLGLGGGIFTVPILHGYQVPLKNAIGTSSVTTLMTALIASLSFLILGTFSLNENLTGSPFGYIDLKAWLTVGLSSLCSAFIGARLSSVISTSLIKRIFGMALTATGALMLFVS